MVIAPVVGFDAEYYRLGHGGGFLDRTLAAMVAAPLAIGLGFAGVSIPTVFPQPHDTSTGWIVTGAMPPVRRDVGLAPRRRWVQG